MVKPRKPSLLSGVFALSLIAAPAFAQEFGEWDANADAGINEEEFRTGFGTDLFNKWDMDDDNALSEEEFNTGIGNRTADFQTRFGENNGFSTWDADANGSLSENEFYGGVYAGYDDDDDNVIEEPEFGDVGDDIGDGGLFDV